MQQNTSPRNKLIAVHDRQLKEDDCYQVFGHNRCPPRVFLGGNASFTPVWAIFARPHPRCCGSAYP